MSTKGARVLVVEDDPYIVVAVRRGLEAHGYNVEECGTLADARRIITGRMPDIILLDLGLPDGDGIELVRWIRTTRATPIVVLSARDSEPAKVGALDEGADDYLTKPFGMPELLARVRVALRHAARPSSGRDAVIRAGDLALDVEKRILTRAGTVVHLTPTEFDLLKALMVNADRIMTHRMLLEAVWGGTTGTDQHYAHVFVWQLRRKIEEDPAVPRHLLTEAGVGYRFVSTPA